MAVERINKILDELIQETSMEHPDYPYLQRLRQSNALYMGSAKREEALNDMEKRRLTPRTIEERNRLVEGILPIVADLFQQPVEAILNGGREKNLVEARIAASYLYNTVCDFGPSEIARRMGGRDHTTILNHLKRADDLMKYDPSFSESISEAEGALGQLVVSLNPELLT